VATIIIGNLSAIDLHWTFNAIYSLVVNVRPYLLTPNADDLRGLYTKT
jgi:hypothetical protein